jgi:uridylate kinase
MTAPAYRRILLKLSGEALMGAGDHSIDPDVLERLAGDVRDLIASGVQVALVIGGGNIFRGAGLAARGLERMSVPARVMSALKINQVCEDYIRRRAMRHLDKGRVVIFAAGTGNPFFTTDSAASLRAIEIGAELLIKATKVDGVYSADPMKDPSATFYPRLSYDQALREGLGVMDATAIVLCRDHAMPLRVMNINEPNALPRLMAGEDVGSLVVSGN